MEALIPLLVAVLTYLESNPEVAAAVATLVGSLGVALSKIGGERFVLLKRLVRLLTSKEPRA